MRSRHLSRFPDPVGRHPADNRGRRIAMDVDRHTGGVLADRAKRTVSFYSQPHTGFQYFRRIHRGRVFPRYFPVRIYEFNRSPAAENGPG